LFTPNASFRRQRKGIEKAMLEIIGYIAVLYLALGVITMATSLWYTQEVIMEIGQERGCSIAKVNLKIFTVGVVYWPRVLYTLRRP
jgi:cell division protein FtsL